MKTTLACAMIILAGGVAVGTIVGALDSKAAEQGRAPSQTAATATENTDSMWVTLPACEDSDGQTACLLYDMGQWELWPAGADTEIHQVVPTASVTTDNTGSLRVHVKGIR